jgi:hypothetical protein
MKIAKKAVAVIAILTLICAIFYIVSNIIAIISYDNVTSFPWWSAFVFAAIYFGPLLLTEGALYRILIFLEKRKR